MKVNYQNILSSELAMPSPFPGVDPYLEGKHYWTDFHHRFLTIWCETIADLLPPAYVARINEWVNLMEVRPHANGKRMGPDIAVERRGPVSGSIGPAAATVATLEPITIPLLLVDEERETTSRFCIARTRAW
jgi:hypothetical protein